MKQQPLAFWSLPAAEIRQQLQTAKEGLAGAEARQRLSRYGSNLLKPSKQPDVLTLLLAQFTSPILLILSLAARLSFFLHDPAEAFIILAIILVSGLLGFWQERGRKRRRSWPRLSTSAYPMAPSGWLRCMILGWARIHKCS